VAILARHVEEKKGTHDGKKYSSVRHYATLVFNPRAVVRVVNIKGIDPVMVEKMIRAIMSGDSLGYETIPGGISIGLGEPKDAKPAADPAATKLLADARAARANWDHFPGFTAEVEVNVEGKRSLGKVEVSSKGKVHLDLKGPAQEWARRMISSIVGHRLDDASTLDTPCAFADDVTEHPMGRAIRVLNDEFHSSYRIRDRQVIEVNRRMADSRFTITVLENRRNAEQKYLPASYVVNTWGLKDGALIRSTTHHNTWQRVGKYDLPLACTIVEASAGKLVNRTLRFFNCKLLEKKAE
jgi:hypothetical protein